MPKKRSVKTWRKSEAGEEFRTTVEESIAKEALDNQADDKLFFIDTGGDKKIQKKLIDDDENRGLSKSEIEKVNKMMERVKENPKKQSKSKSNVVVDLWDTKPEKKNVNNWIDRKDSALPLKPIRPRKMYKPTNLPAVKVPVPGSSYNPDKELYQDALGEAVHKEIQYEKHQERLKQLPGSVTLNQLRDYKMNINIEDDALLNSDHEDNDQNEIEETPKLNPWNMPTQTKIKSKAQRKREEKHKKMLREHQKAKLRNVYRQTIANAKNISKEIELDAAAKEERKKQEEEVKQLLKERDPNAIYRSGRKIMEKPKLEVYLSDEIPKSMRQMPNVYNPLYDRMQSLEKRHLIDKGTKPSKYILKKMKETRMKYKSPFVKYNH